MSSLNHRRRMVLKTGLGIGAAASWPNIASAQATPRIRLEWQQFRKTPQYQSFLTAIAAMRLNMNPSDRRSLQYWANVHVHHCPHGAPYFIAWHRGYLYYFEQQLRIVSGDASLNLPYWNYYSYATLPAEFTDDTPGNPLYMPRMSANVYSALSLAPFASSVVNFQHGTPNAFEPKIEDIHNPVHDLIGGIMSTMQSPLDPIFYLHHASVDRLTHAWALPDGKGIPLSAYPYSTTNSDPYWAGNHVYASDLTIERYKTLEPGWLGNDYASTSKPSALPAPPATLATAAGARAASPAPQPLRRPPFQSFRVTERGRISAHRRSLGGAAQLPLDEQSASVLLRLDRTDAADVARAVAARRQREPDRNREAPAAVKIVIDRALVNAGAARGGYFYALYLNMPAAIDSPAARAGSFIGTLGAFQVAAASHHGPARIEYDVSDLLARQQRTDFSELSLSWVRVDGDNPPTGRALHVDEARIELASEPQPVQPPPLARPVGWYGKRR